MPLFEWLFFLSTEDLPCQSDEYLLHSPTPLRDEETESEGFIVYYESWSGLQWNDIAPARKASAGAMPGRCGFCLRAETHRRTFVQSVEAGAQGVADNGQVQ
jgi:hypothetical protein